MSATKGLGQRLAGFGIAAFCFGYFASYIPYSMMTKMITLGLFSGMEDVRFSGFMIAPAVAIATFIAMYLYITLAGWWKYATHWNFLGMSFPRPQWFTFISGLCTAGIIVTTTLAYTFSGISIVFAMLLMRGGVLILAPIVDLIVRKRKRKIYWPSWVAAGLSIAALLVTFNGKSGTALAVVAAVDIGIYLFSYFIRFIYMGGRAKSEDTNEMKRYLVEEQMTANPMLVIILFIVAWFGRGMSAESFPAQLWQGFTTFMTAGFFWHAFAIGVFSYGTGLFGSLILLDRREHTFCVPANRCSSVVAGIVATYLLAVFYGQKFPPATELIGAGLILAAIVFLCYRSIAEKRAKRMAKAVCVENACQPMECCGEAK